MQMELIELKFVENIETRRFVTYNISGLFYENAQLLNKIQV